jgi:hypothetical protein
MNELVPSQRRQSEMLPEHASDDTVIALWLRKYKKHPKTLSAYSADITRFCAFIRYLVLMLSYLLPYYAILPNVLSA